MDIIQGAVLGEKRAATVEAIRNHQPFTTYGAMYATNATWFYTEGWLGWATRDGEQLLKDRPNLAYVIYSYETPIAWATKDGERHMVERKFSPTTSRHQKIIKEAWA